MIDFFRRLFGHSGSSSAAKDRLRLVLMTDHLELSPELVDSMKRDLVDVISRYVEVDREKIDVSFERQDKALAMLANIPILAVNRSTNGHLETPATQPPGDGVVQPEAPVVDAESPVVDAEAPIAAAESPVEPDAAGESQPAVAGDIKRRRRRRKRKGAASSGATQPVSAT